ncbi:coniferyl-alcohol dehydrogenase [Rhizobium sp. BR 315]|uniref:coniferyl-alcohol dehydrogenase n=1 Tax=Rhizobium sp. BR 315 TaxID=3040014 RepID=UPI003D359601
MLYGKTVVITGVSAGIGARAVELAVSLGADVVGIDINEPKDHRAGFIKGDLSHPEGISAVVRQLPTRFDALLNVAGISGKVGAEATLAVNFYGLRAFTEACAPSIREGGAVISVASVAGYGWRANIERAKAMVGEPGFPDIKAVMQKNSIPNEIGYPLSKELLILWTQKAAHEPLFKDRGIRVNAVSPGPVDTTILKEFRAVLGDQKVDSDIVRVGRAATASDIAPVILFLASDGARWINGANISNDGGLEASINAEVLGF